MLLYFKSIINIKAWGRGQVDPFPLTRGQGCHTAWPRVAEYHKYNILILNEILSKKSEKLCKKTKL